MRVVCFNKAEETTTERCGGQHRDVPLRLPYLCVQSLFWLPCIPQQSLEQKEWWEGVNDPRGLTMGHRDARRTLDDIEDCYIRLCLLGSHWGWVGRGPGCLCLFCLSAWAEGPGLGALQETAQAQGFLCKLWNAKGILFNFWWGKKKIREVWINLKCEVKFRKRLQKNWNIKKYIVCLFLRFNFYKFLKPTILASL